MSAQFYNKRQFYPQKNRSFFVLRGHSGKLWTFDKNCCLFFCKIKNNRIFILLKDKKK